MNSLNSILVEGKVITSPAVEVIHDDSFSVSFVLETEEFHSILKDEVRVTHCFTIETWSKLASRAMCFPEGTHIRVVGRLKQKKYVGSSGKECSSIVITAEHIEVKPCHEEDDVDEKDQD